MEETDVIICRCEEIRRSEIIQAIKEGSITINGIKKRTRAGMGLCQGKTCSRTIAQLISKYTGIPLKQILPATFRPPIRTIKLKSLGGEGDCCPKQQM